MMNLKYRFLSKRKRIWSIDLQEESYYLWQTECDTYLLALRDAYIFDMVDNHPRVIKQTISGLIRLFVSYDKMCKRNLKFCNYMSDLILTVAHIFSFINTISDPDSLSIMFNLNKFEKRKMFRCSCFQSHWTPLLSFNVSLPPYLYS